MAIFEKFPYTDLHNLNLNWMINKMKEFQAGYEDQLDQIQAVQTATEELQRALQEDEGNLADAVRALDAAIDALPADVRTEVQTYVDANLSGIVAAQLDDVVAEQLPDELSHQIAGQVSDWLEENLSDPPLDPTMTIRGAVPDAKDVGAIFGYVENPKIEGYSQDWKAVTPTVTTGHYYKLGENDKIDMDTRVTLDAYRVSGLVGGQIVEISGNWSSGYGYMFAVRDEGELTEKNIQTFSTQSDLAPYGGGNLWRIPVPYGATDFLINQANDVALTFRKSKNQWSKSVAEGYSVDLVSEGSGDYSVANWNLGNFQELVVDKRESMILHYPGTAGYAKVINYAGTTTHPLSITVLRSDGYLIKYTVTQSGTDLLLTQNAISIDLYNVQAGGMILNAAAGTGGTYVLDNESIDDLTFLMEQGIPVWISWPTSGTDLNLSQVVGWDVQTSSFGMTCIDGQGNYRKLSAEDDLQNGDVVLTVVSESEVEGSSVEIVTATATESTVIGLAYQQFLAEARLSPGVNVAIAYEHDEYDLSDLLSRIGTAISQGKAVFLTFNIAVQPITVPVSTIRRGCIGFAFNTEDSITGTQGYSTVNANVTLSSDETGVIITGAIYTGLET